MIIREKKHRLSKEFYQGMVSVAYTLCFTGSIKTAVQPSEMQVFVGMLSDIAKKHSCIVPVYCFMPDHQHIILTGTMEGSDSLKAAGEYKQRTGFWLYKNRPALKWQKDFYDHVIKKDDNIATQVRYLLDNPVRRGIVTSWQDYAYKGSIGCNFDEILMGII